VLTVLVTSACIWSALQEGQASNLPESDYNMSIFGEAAGAAAAQAAAEAGGALRGDKPSAGPRGSNKDGVPITPKDKPTLTPIPGVAPDSNGGAAVAPVDLSLIAGPTDLPQRRPLKNVSVGVPQTGVTGYAGVFIP
jgi:hypothetical protein